MLHLKKYFLLYIMLVASTYAQSPNKSPLKHQTYEQLIQKLYPFATPVIASSISLAAYVWDIRVQKTEPRITDALVLPLMIVGLDQALRYAIDRLTGTKTIHNHNQNIIT